MKYRKITSNLLKKINENIPNTENKLTLKKIDYEIKQIYKHKPLSSEIITTQYPIELFALDLLLVTLGKLVTITGHLSEDQKKIINNDFSARDSNLCAFVNNICNTALSAIHLVKLGFDTQSKILIRTMDERIYQCLVLFYSSDDYNHWHEAQDQEGAKSAHYSLFSKKGRLMKKIGEIEHSFLNDTNAVSELMTWRKESEGFYSMAVHGSSTAVLAGSMAYSFIDDKMLFPNLFGVPSSASESSLVHILFQLNYFITLLSLILSNIHKWTPDMTNKNESEYINIGLIAQDLSMKIIQHNQEK